MKVRIIPKSQKYFYDKQIDGQNAIKPYELTTSEFCLSDSLLEFLQTYADNETYPQSVRESARLTKLELESLELREITEADLKTGEMPEEVDLFPHEGLNIRVDITNEAITDMMESEWMPLINYALSCEKIKTATGRTIWLSRLENPQMSAEQVRNVLEQIFGAQILIKE